MGRFIIALVTAASLGGAAIAAEKDSYYYPPVNSEETFSREIGPASPADRQVRVGFTTQITKAQLALWRKSRQLVEPAGAAALAALTSGAYRPEPGEKVAVLVCGANISSDPLT